MLHHSRERKHSLMELLTYTRLLQRAGEEPWPRAMGTKLAVSFLITTAKQLVVQLCLSREIKMMKKKNEEMRMTVCLCSCYNICQHQFKLKIKCSPETQMITQAPFRVARSQRGAGLVKGVDMSSGSILFNSVRANYTHPEATIAVSFWASLLMPETYF